MTTSNLLIWSTVGSEYKYRFGSKTQTGPLGYALYVLTKSDSSQISSPVLSDGTSGDVDDENAGSSDSDDDDDDVQEDVLRPEHADEHERSFRGKGNSDSDVTSLCIFKVSLNVPILNRFPVELISVVGADLLSCVVGIFKDNAEPLLFIFLSSF